MMEWVYWQQGVAVNASHIGVVSLSQRSHLNNSAPCCTVLVQLFTNLVTGECEVLLNPPTILLHPSTRRKGACVSDARAIACRTRVDTACTAPYCTGNAENLASWAFWTESWRLQRISVKHFRPRKGIFSREKSRIENRAHKPPRENYGLPFDKSKNLISPFAIRHFSKKIV